MQDHIVNMRCVASNSIAIKMHSKRTEDKWKWTLFQLVFMFFWRRSFIYFLQQFGFFFSSDVFEFHFRVRHLTTVAALFLSFLFSFIDILKIESVSNCCLFQMTFVFVFSSSVFDCFDVNFLKYKKKHFYSTLTLNFQPIYWDALLFSHLFFFFFFFNFFVNIIIILLLLFLFVSEFSYSTLFLRLPVILVVKRAKDCVASCNYVWLEILMRIFPFVLEKINLVAWFRSSLHCVV